MCMLAYIMLSYIIEHNNQLIDVCIWTFDKNCILALVAMVKSSGDTEIGLK
jgi:hypothetical protein